MRSGWSRHVRGVMLSKVNRFSRRRHRSGTSDSFACRMVGRQPRTGGAILSERENGPYDPPASALEARIVAATVGTPQTMNGTIELAPYDPAWPSHFGRLAGEVRAALGHRARRIEHVGSTSVPGLFAKPVIDMILVVDDSSDEAAYVPPLEAAGFALRIREPEWNEHRLLSPSRIPANLHVFSVGCPEVEQMVLLRDWLRSHEEDRALYERTKQELANRTWRHVQEYADAKSEVVRAILARADRGSGAES